LRRQVQENVDPVTTASLAIQAASKPCDWEAPDARRDKHHHVDHRQAFDTAILIAHQFMLMVTIEANNDGALSKAQTSAILDQTLDNALRDGEELLDHSHFMKPAVRFAVFNGDAVVARPRDWGISACVLS